MRPEKILFLGLGGAGQRHLRMFREILPEVSCSTYRATRKTPLLNADFSVDRDRTVEEKYGLTTFDGFDAALADRPDLVVISTPSALHREAALRCAREGIHLFVEKPFSHTLEGFEDVRREVLSRGLCFQVSFQRRFHPQIARVKELLIQGRLGRVFSAVFEVASYVPAWHPYERYQDLYACRRDLGGGVLATEIHELDLCHWFFGEPRAVGCVGGNISGIALDVEDTAHLLLRYDGLTVSVILGFMERRNRRFFRIAGTDGCVEWSADGTSLVFEDYRTGVVDTWTEVGFANDAMFRAQAAHFVDAVTPEHSAGALEASWFSLAMVEAARRSMAAQGAPVTLEEVRDRDSTPQNVPLA